MSSTLNSKSVFRTYYLLLLGESLRLPDKLLSSLNSGEMLPILPPLVPVAGGASKITLSLFDKYCCGDCLDIWAHCISSLCSDGRVA